MKKNLGQGASRARVTRATESATMRFATDIPPHGRNSFAELQAFQRVPRYYQFLASLYIHRKARRILKNPTAAIDKANREAVALEEEEKKEGTKTFFPEIAKRALHHRRRDSRKHGAPWRIRATTLAFLPLPPCGNGQRRSCIKKTAVSITE